ncbi:MAG TPA: AfsR/SARP family transcriptional regulator [Gaiellaceae bacterium]|jgi:DNA-binding SARP family transcriptional activator|nr:AfsR/SARP family transcriptional regulator [Gaiellaceae bacterium]HWJ44118.1 AfsR/SARP family transcriptional regulator [Gaiellaceae bacterium]
MTDFRLLGPLEVIEGGERVPLPAGQPSAVLARLLLDANRPVSPELLVDAIWGDPPPASAPKVLQAYVSQLRKAIGPERIETQPAGYAVRVQPEELDLTRFEELTEKAGAAADPSRRASLLRNALSLWRGAPLADFRTQPFAAPAARRLNELRLAALEERIDAELALGNHGSIVAEAESLVAEEPLRERPRRQLMLALYRSGRRADALASYADARRQLVEELGLEPGASLRELERAILRDDPALAGSEPPAAVRGAVITTSAALLELLSPLVADGRELLLIDVVPAGDELRVHHDPRARATAFTSDAPGADLAHLAAEQRAELLVVTDHSFVPAAAACDVALASEREFTPAGPIVAPFGGAREEWAALELAAWLARAHGVPLRLLGTEASGARRDASRMLASASLALQRFTQVAAEPVLVPPGPEGVLAQESSAIVASFPRGELGGSRARLLEQATVPVLLVRGGLRPSGVAPDHTLTRFSWSLGESVLPHLRGD